ncbi:hypothetical protein [Nocardia sp. IFM 10818]
MGLHHLDRHRTQPRGNRRPRGVGGRRPGQPQHRSPRDEATARRRTGRFRARLARPHRPLPRQLPELTERADERRAERIARVQAERADFWGFWDIVAENWSAREITGYTSAADVERDTPAYLAAAIPDAQPPDTPDEPQGPDDEDEAALALLQLELGATILEEALCP